MANYEVCGQLILDISWDIGVFFLDQGRNSVLIGVSTLLLIIFRMKKIGGLTQALGEVASLFFVFWLVTTLTLITVTRWELIEKNILMVFECARTRS